MGNLELKNIKLGFILIRLVKWLLTHMLPAASSLAELPAK
jgi:hypothetical protein